MIDDAETWAGTSERVVFTGDRGRRGPAAWEGRVTALLPGRSDVAPASVEVVRLPGRDRIGIAAVFDPALPDGSVVLVDGRPLYTVGT